MEKRKNKTKAGTDALQMQLKHLMGHKSSNSYLSDEQSSALHNVMMHAQSKNKKSTVRNTNQSSNQKCEVSGCNEEKIRKCATKVSNKSGQKILCGRNICKAHCVQLR
jgi:hypothetical protein